MMATSTRVDPANPQDVTSFQAQEVGLSENEPHFRMGYLDPPPDWQIQAPVGDLTDSAGVGIIGKDGKVLRNYDMPRYLSSNISAHRIEAYFRLHPKFSYDDIEARQPSWCPPLNRHSFSNVRLRKGRRPFNARCFVRACSYPPKVDVELVESLSMLQIMLNTGWIITPRGIHDLKHPGRLYPLDQFLHGERWHTPSVEIAQAIAESHRLKALAITHGKSHWRELPNQLLPREWFQRTKGAKVGKGSRDGGVHLNNGLTMGGLRPMKRNPATAELDTDDGTETSNQSSKRPGSPSRLSVGHQAKAKTANSRQKPISEDCADEDGSQDDDEGYRVKSRPLKRLRTRANATVGEAGVHGAEYQGSRLSRSTQEQGEIPRSGRITRSSKLGNSSGARKLGKIASSGLTSSDVTASANSLSFGGHSLLNDPLYKRDFESHISIDETSHMHGHRAGDRTGLRGTASMSSQYPNLDTDASIGPSNPYFALGYRPVTQGETSFGGQPNLHARASGNLLDSDYRYGDRDGEARPDGPPDYGHTRSDEHTNNTNEFPSVQGARDILSSRSMLREAAVLAPDLLDPQLLAPLLRPPGPSHPQQQSQRTSNPRSHVTSTIRRSSAFNQADHRPSDSQLTHLDSGPIAGQPFLSEAMDARSGQRTGTVPTVGIDSPHALLLEQGSNMQEHTLEAISQPSRLGDFAAQGIAQYSQPQADSPSPEDGEFDEFVQPYDSYGGEGVSPEFDGQFWQSGDN